MTTHTALALIVFLALFYVAGLHLWRIRRLLILIAQLGGLVVLIVWCQCCRWLDSLRSA